MKGVFSRCLLTGAVLLLVCHRSEGQEACAPSCEGVLESGTQVKDPSNCLRYYVCADVDGSGNLQLSDPIDCFSGYFFNMALVTPKCDRIDSAHEGYCSGYCNPCQPECSTAGTYLPNPSNCSNYYACLHPGSPMEARSCSQAPDLYYDFRSGECSDDAGACFGYCHECEPYCVEAGNIPDPTDCTKFFLCDPPFRVHYSCPEGQVFDPVLKLCSASEECDDEAAAACAAGVDSSRKQQSKPLALTPW